MTGLYKCINGRQIHDGATSLDNSLSPNAFLASTTNTSCMADAPELPGRECYLCDKHYDDPNQQFDEVKTVVSPYTCAALCMAQEVCHGFNFDKHCLLNMVNPTPPLVTRAGAIAGNMTCLLALGIGNSSMPISG